MAPLTTGGTCSSSRNMSSRASASWRKFHVLPSGGSCAVQVQEELIQRLTYRGHQRVNHPQDCDYYLVFCPISSRVGTDISESERNIPGDKPAVLVVLHHTFNPQYVFRQSKLLVTKANVALTVDMLFHQGALLRCSRNDQALSSVETFIWDLSSSRRRWWKLLFWPTVIAIAGLSIYLIYLGVELKKKSSP